MKIKLTPAQEIRAARVGFRRQENAVRKGWAPRHRGGSLWGGHIEGACAELAASLVMDLPWTGEEVWDRPPRERVPDLGTATEVRWSDKVPVLYLDAERDRRERYYVVVTGRAPEFDVVGFIRGDFGERLGEIVEYPERKVYKVKAKHLTPIVGPVRLAA